MAPIVSARFSDSAPFSPRFVSGLTRALGVLVAGLLGVVLWRVLIDVGFGPVGPFARRAPQLTGDEVASRLGGSLALLVAALAVGLVAGLAIAGVVAALTGASREAGPVVGGLGWLAGMPWIALSPAAFTVFLVVLVHRPPTPPLGGSLVVVALGGLAAVLVSVGTVERWQRGQWAAGAFAAAAASGRAVAAIAGGLVVAEAIVRYPGLGTLATDAMLQRDPNALLAAVTPLLVVALIGQLLAALATAVADHLHDPIDADVGPPSPLGATMLAVALATLAVPAIVLLASSFAGDATRPSLGSVFAGPSPLHPLGTDELGRDVLAQLLVGFRTTWLTATGGVLLAIVVGGVWGWLAALLRGVPRVGWLFAELLLTPGWVLIVAPLLVAGVVLAGADRLPAVLVLALVLAPRVAVAAPDLAGGPPAPGAVARGFGLGLCCLGVALTVLVGLQVVGVATPPPTPSLGGVIATGLVAIFVNATAVLAVLVALVTTAPFFLAGWALLRHARAGEALTVLEA